MLPDADIEIVEIHHNRKLDAPSGTALLLADAVKEARGDVPLVCGRSGQQKRTPGEIGIHSLRMGVTVGRLREDSIFDYKFVGLSHNTLRGAAGGGVLIAELLYKLGYLDLPEEG